MFFKRLKIFFNGRPFIHLPPETFLKKMIYDPHTRRLWTSEWAVLKTLGCPSAKLWDGLVQIPGADDTCRHCATCGKNVFNLSDMTENEIVALIRRDPGACVYISDDPRNIAIRVRGTSGPPPPLACPAALVRTARDLQTMNDAARGGCRPLVVKLASADKIRSRFPVFRLKYAVLQNDETGEIRLSQGQQEVCSGWSEVIPAKGFYPDLPWLPFAAYLLPPGTQAGDRCYLEDLIEGTSNVERTRGGGIKTRGFYQWDGASMVEEPRPTASDYGYDFIG